jgi:HK97 family phage portal protein
VRVISEVASFVPFSLYETRLDGGFDGWDDPFLGPIFDDRANPWQDPQEWRQTVTAHALLWKESISEKKVGRNGLEVWPIHPDYITTTEQLRDGTLRWVVNEPNVPQRTLVQDQVFRLKGWGAHTFMGADVLRLARETIGLWLAQEKFGALYFAQGAKGSVWLQHPSQLSDTARKRLDADNLSNYSGFGNVHKAFLVEEGITVHEVGNSAKDAQLNEFREALVHEAARWFNIPVHMLRAGDQPTFASVEQFAREFIDITMRPWYRRWERRVKFDLIQDKRIVARHILDELLSGSMLERYQAWASAIMNGWMSQNEARIKEGMNPHPDAAMDKPARSTNQGNPADQSGQAVVGGEPKAIPAAPVAKKKKKKPIENASVARVELFARTAAERVIAKETARLGALATKHAANIEGWNNAVAEFYAQHAEHVAETMILPPLVARQWTDRQSTAAQAGGMTLVAGWDRDCTEALTRLALGVS